MSELEFNVPFQHKHDYIRDDKVSYKVTFMLMVCLLHGTKLVTLGS